MSDQDLQRHQAISEWQVTTVSRQVTIPLARHFPTLDITQHSDGSVRVYRIIHFVDPRGHKHEYCAGIKVIHNLGTQDFQVSIIDLGFIREGWPRLCRTRDDMIEAVEECRWLLSREYGQYAYFSAQENGTKDVTRQDWVVFNPK